MNARKILLKLVTTYAIFHLIPLHAATAPVFTPEQQARIGQIAADYLVNHPEILVQVSKKLQLQQQERQQTALARRVLENEAALLKDKDTPVIGPENADVAVIEFFDYQCIYCSRLAPELEKVMKASPEVRYIFKEWPIFASRWENSERAALRGLDVWKQKGAAGYALYHNGIYHTGHNEGQLTAGDIENSAKSAGATEQSQGDFHSILEQNSMLAQGLELTGTPALIVMPVKGATPTTITVFPGLASAEQIQAAIKKARN